MQIRLLSAIIISCLLWTSGSALEYRWSPTRTDIVGEVDVYHSRQGDNFVSIARRYSVAYDELRSANPGRSPYKVRSGTPVTLPRLFILPNVHRDGIVVNLPERRIYYFQPHRGRVTTYPIGIGRPGWRTPLLNTRIIEKEVDPVWNVPKSIKRAAARKGRYLPNVVAAGPRNPLGQFAMRLGNRNYLIHGTNNPNSIGKRVSSGCIRLYPEDIAALYRVVPMHTPVRIIHQEIKVGWARGRLYLEAHPPLREYRRSSVRTTILQALSQRRMNANHVDWGLVNRVIQQKRGTPVRISR